MFQASPSYQTSRPPKSSEVSGQIPDDSPPARGNDRTKSGRPRNAQLIHARRGSLDPPPPLSLTRPRKISTGVRWGRRIIEEMSPCLRRGTRSQSSRAASRADRGCRRPFEHRLRLKRYPTARGSHPTSLWTRTSPHGSIRHAQRPTEHRPGAKPQRRAARRRWRARRRRASVPQPHANINPGTTAVSLDRSSAAVPAPMMAVVGRSLPVLFLDGARGLDKRSDRGSRWPRPSLPPLGGLELQPTERSGGEDRPIRRRTERRGGDGRG